MVTKFVKDWTVFAKIPASKCNSFRNNVYTHKMHIHAQHFTVIWKFYHTEEFN